MNIATPKSKSNIFYFFTILFFLFVSYLSNAQVGINTVTPNSTLEINGSLGEKLTSITSDTTLDATYNTVVCNNGGTAITINLPTAISPACNGRIYTIKKGTNSTKNINIDGNSSETIDGVATFVLSDEQGAVAIVSDGTEWKVISKHLSPYPVGEVSFFKISGTSITIPSISTGSNNMVVCNVATPTVSSSKPVNEFSTNGSGRLTYNGKTTRTFHIACTISATSSNSTDRYVFGVGQNGTVLPASKVIQKMGGSTDTQSTAIHVVAVLAEGDWLELMAGNLTNPGTNITINSLCLFALGM